MGPKSKDKDILETKREKKREKMRRYRENVKKDKERYDEYKNRERQRKRESYKNKVERGNPEEIRQRKTEKMRAYRARKREKEATEELLISPARIIAGKRNLRKKHKPKKDSMSERLKRKQISKQVAVKRTQAWRLRVALSKSSSVAQFSSVSPKMSKVSKWRICNRVKEQLPKTPAKRACIIDKLANSPSVSKYLESKGGLRPDIRRRLSMGDHLLSSMKLHLEQVKPTGNSSAMRRHSYQILKSVANGFNKTYSRQKHSLKRLLKSNLALKNKREAPWWKPAVKKQRKDKLSLDIQQEIQNFFLLPEVSRDVPNKKDVVYVKDLEGHKVSMQKKVMVLSLHEAYEVYKVQHSDRKISFSSFYKHKPKNVRRISETSRRCCLCTACCNMSLKVEALKKFLDQSGEAYKTLSKDKKELAKLSMCSSNNDDPPGLCLTRQCAKCGTTSVKQMFNELLNNEGKDPIPYHKWAYVKIERDGNTKTIMSCVQKVSPFVDFFEELLKDLETYPAHYFRAVWQQKQMAKCMSKIGAKEAMMVLDYSENYACKFQDEVQSAFFDQNQVTILPIMVYYKVSKGESVHLVKHSIIGITDDTKHDADAVLSFEDAALQLLKDQGIEFSKIHQFTDGCAAQFKGRKSFADISLRHFHVQRNYFETSHGKSVCDGLGAVVKNACHHAVLSGKSILGNAMEVFKYCENTLTHNERLNKGDNTYSKREFIFVKQVNVNRNRVGVDVKTLKGTRKLHAVRGTGTGYKINTRELSCYCDGCYSNTNSCDNVEYVGHWKDAQLELNQEAADCPIVRQSVKKNTGKSASKSRCRIAHAAHPQSEPEEDYDVGNFVAVRVPGKRRAVLYPAEVLKIDHDTVVLKYMKPSGKYFVWPDEDDVYEEGLDSIICKLSNPKLINEREQYLFDHVEIDKAKLLL